MKREVEEEEELKEREREVMSLKSKKKRHIDTWSIAASCLLLFHYLFSSLVLFMVLIQLNETSSSTVTCSFFFCSRLSKVLNNYCITSPHVCLKILHSVVLNWMRKISRERQVFTSPKLKPKKKFSQCRSQWRLKLWTQTWKELGFPIQNAPSD